MKILLVDDEKLSREMMAKYLEGLLGLNVVQSGNGSEAFELFLKDNFSLVIADIRMPGLNGIDLLQNIKESDKAHSTKVILITGFANVDSAVAALRYGALDYLTKPVDIKRLTELVNQRAKEVEEESSFIADSESDTTKSSTKHSAINYLNRGSYYELPDGSRVGFFSPYMKEIIAMAMKFHEDRSIPVLIEGESGTGKEVFTKIIHYGLKQSESNEPLISLNCSAISRSLFESELFGYEGGTFTGAKDSGMLGKLEMAEGGTLFLDEIGDMPLEMQPKLLRVLQDKTFYRIGGQKIINLNVRFIGATNKRLEELVKEGKFRQDLYQRLKLGWLYLPPLREQKEYIPLYAQMFLNEISEKRNKQFRFISKDAVKILKEFPWNGNIRELRNTIERIVLLYDEIELLPEHLKILDVPNKELINSKLSILNPYAFQLPQKPFDIKEYERQIVRQTLEKFEGNKSKTCQYLGITLSALRSRLK